MASTAAGIMWNHAPPSRDPAARATSQGIALVSVASFAASVTLPTSAIALMSSPVPAIQPSVLTRAPRVVSSRRTRAVESNDVRRPLTLPDRAPPEASHVRTA